MSDFALHGFTQSPAAWQRLLPEVHAPRLLGHGPEPDLTRRSWSEELSRLATQALALPAPRRLLGYSLGARLGLGLLVEHPGLFASACLVSGSAGLESDPARAERRESDAGWTTLLRTRGLEAFLERWEAQPLFASQASATGEARGAQARERREHTAEGLALSLEVLGLGQMPWLGEPLARVSVPVLWLVGEHDAKFRALGEGLMGRFPSARLALVPGAGHNPLLENPAALGALLA